MVGAVVLAAGAASRYGSPKQHLFMPRVVDALRASSVDDIVVVAGAYQLDAGVRVAYCAEWERGPGASLRCGLNALVEEAEAAIVVLADGPNLDPRAVDRVIDAWHDGRGERLAATYDGVNRSHPVLLDDTTWNHIPDAGARVLPVTLVPCVDLAAPGDIDTPQ